jgi:hypothetical protein
MEHLTVICLQNCLSQTLGVSACSVWLAVWSSTVRLWVTCSWIAQQCGFCQVFAAMQQGQEAPSLWPAFVQLIQSDWESLSLSLQIQPAWVHTPLFCEVCESLFSGCI